MSNAYWVATYRAVHDPERLTAYSALAGPVITEHGGRFLARGLPERVYEAAPLERTVVIEFPTLEQAVGAYESAAYRTALAALGDGATRDVRIVPGV